MEDRVDAGPTRGAERGICVAHIAEALGGGLLEVVRITAEGNREAGMRVLLFHGRRPESPKGTLRQVLPVGVEIVEVPGWGERRPLGELRAALWLRRELALRDVDVAVFHSSFAGVAGAALRLACPTVFTPHAFASKAARAGSLSRFIYRLGERLACSAHDITACVSHSEARVAKSLGAKVVVAIPNGIPGLDAPIWPPEPDPPQEPLVVGVGRLVPQRRPIETAAVLQGVRDLARVQWLGGGSHGAYSQDAEQVLTLAGIPISGWLTHERAAEELRAASIYVHWTSWDGLSVTLLEAIANDVVVIASDTEPNREVLGPDAVHRTEGEAIAAIRTLLADPEAWRARILDQRARACNYGATVSQGRWNHLLAAAARSSDQLSVGTLIQQPVIVPVPTPM
jgi:glycosyltransferase involved in cell wall biosynthesis